MKDLTSKLDQARANFLKRAGIAPEASPLATLAWNDGTQVTMKLMTEWAKKERLRLERIHAYETRRQ